MEILRIGLSLAGMALILMAIRSFNRSRRASLTLINTEQSQLKNDAARNYNFLSGMYRDSYFRDFLVDKCQVVLVDLCHRIEHDQPRNLKQLYRLTHDATRRINAIQPEFDANECELETVARDVIGMDFAFIAQAYRFENADVEELIAPRDW
jgi:hypothetical protein